MSGIEDVALRAGVSKATVSRALSGRGYVSTITRSRVETAANELGYVVSSNASSLVTGRTNNVGVIIPVINQWFFGSIIEGVERALLDRGYDLMLYNLTKNTEARSRVFEYFLVRKRVDAVIAVGIALTRSEVGLLHGLKKPIVGIGGDIEGISTLSIDDVASSRLATEHIIGLGHTRIMHLGGDQDEQMDFSVHAHRLAGYRAALAEAGISQDDDFRSTHFSIPGGFEAGLAVLADPRSRPTAVVAGCDEIAIGVILAARQLGIQVPQQLSVVGIDDHALSEMFGLTTIRQEPGNQGALAVDLVMQELADPSEEWRSRALRVDVTMQVRSSTTAPPTSA